MSFYGNFGNEGEWRNHLQNQAYVDDLKQSFRDTASIVSSGIASQSDDMINGINRAMFEQTSRINHYLSQVNEEMKTTFKQSIEYLAGSIHGDLAQLAQNVSENFNELIKIEEKNAQLLTEGNWQRSIQLEQQRINNVLTHNIAELLRIPEFQKERKYYIEQGLRLFANGSINNDLYGDALEYLLKALEIDKTDYFVLYRIGLVYMYAPNCIDLEQAEFYFSNAAKYASVETHPEAIVLLDVLNYDVGSDLTGIKTSKDKITLFAAEANYQAGIACYLQKKSNEAVKFLQKSVTFVPENKDYQYFYSKVLCDTNRDSEAVNILTELYHNDPAYILMTFTDFELLTSKEVCKLLKLFKDLTVGLVTYMLEDYAGTTDVTLKTYISRIKELLAKDNYLDAVKAKEMIEMKGQWEVPELKRKTLLTTKIMAQGIYIYNAVRYDSIWIFGEPVRLSVDNEVFSTLETTFINKWKKIKHLLENKNCQSVYMCKSRYCLAYHVALEKNQTVPVFELIDTESARIVEIYQASYDQLLSPISYCMDDLGERIYYINKQKSIKWIGNNEKYSNYLFPVSLKIVPNAASHFIGFDNEYTRLVFSDLDQMITYFDLNNEQMIVPKEEVLQGYGFYSMIYDQILNRASSGEFEETFFVRQMTQFEELTTQRTLTMNEYHEEIKDVASYRDQLKRYVKDNTIEKSKTLLDIKPALPTSKVNKAAVKPLEAKEKAMLVYARNLELEYHGSGKFDYKLPYSNIYSAYYKAFLNHEIDKAEFRSITQNYVVISDQLVSKAKQMAAVEALKPFLKKYVNVLVPCNEAFKIWCIIKKSKIDTTQLNIVYDYGMIVKLKLDIEKKA